MELTRGGGHCSPVFHTTHWGCFGLDNCYVQSFDYGLHSLEFFCFSLWECCVLNPWFQVLGKHPTTQSIRCDVNTLFSVVRATKLSWGTGKCRGPLEGWPVLPLTEPSLQPLALLHGEFFSSKSPSNWGVLTHTTLHCSVLIILLTIQGKILFIIPISALNFSTGIIFPLQSMHSLLFPLRLFICVFFLLPSRKPTGKGPKLPKVQKG